MLYGMCNMAELVAEISNTLLQCVCSHSWQWGVLEKFVEEGKLEQALGYKRPRVPNSL